MTATVQIAGPRPLVAATRVLLWAFIVVAITAAVTSVILGVIALVQTLGSTLTHVTLVADKGAALFDQNASSAAVHIVSGQFANADVVVDGLPAGIRAVAITSSIATIVVEVTLCLMIALLAWRMLRRQPFRLSLTVSVSVSGLALVIGGSLAQASTAIVGGATAAQLNAAQHSGAVHGYWPVAGRFDPTLPVVGIVLVLVALAFEYGERLQKETEGLV